MKILVPSGPDDAELQDEVEGYPSDETVRRALEEQRAESEALLRKEDAEFRRVRAIAAATIERST